MQVDNTTAVGFIHKQIKQQQSKAIDMRYYWLQDRQQQQQFRIYWYDGTKNLEDYFTKHLPPTHHINKRSTYLHQPKYKQHNHSSVPKTSPISHVINVCNLCIHARNN